MKNPYSDGTEVVYLGNSNLNFKNGVTYVVKESREGWIKVVGGTNWCHASNFRRVY